MRYGHHGLVLGIALGLLLPLATAWELDAQTGVTASDNISRTSYRAYRQAAETYTANVSVLQSRQITGDWLGVISGEAGYDWVPRFTSLDTTRLGARLLLRRKFGLGPMAPVLDLSTTQTVNTVHEGGRSGWNSEAEAALGKRLNESLRLSASGGWSEYYASHHSFDVREHHLSLSGDWDVTEEWRLSAGARRQWGELTANTESEIWWQALGGAFGQRVRNYYWNTPWEESNSFGPEWVAYRVEAVADFAWAQVSYAMDARTSLSVRYESVKVINKVDIRYDTHLWSFNLVHRF
jgi:hypothetical protein